MRYLFLIVALIFNASANILIKIGAVRLGEIRGMSVTDLMFKLATNYFLIIGLFCFVFNLLFYVIALTKINVSVAYPIMTTGGFLAISCFSFFYLKESITITQIIGIVLIVIGITLVAYNLK